MGCGDKCKPDHIGFDLKDCGQEHVVDLTKGIPLEDNVVDEVYTSHFVEHIKEEDISPLIKEVIRVSKNGTIVTINCPHSSRDEAYYLSHLTRWDERRIRGICDGLNGCGGNTFEIIKNNQEGMELQVILKVIK